MSHKIRLGPIAIFLAVVAVVLTTLATLTLATSNADRVMAERFAKVTQIRYDLEAEGNRYIKDLDENKDAEALGAEKTDDGGFRKTISKDGYDLVIEITDPGDSGEYEITRWEMTKEWEAEDPFDNIWQGGN